MTVTPPRHPSQYSRQAESMSSGLGPLPPMPFATSASPMRAAGLGARIGKGSLALGILIVLGVVLLAATRVFGVPSSRVSVAGSVVQANPAPPAPLSPRLLVQPEVLQPPQRTVPSGANSLVVPPGLVASPEGRLLAIYRAIAEYRMAEALEMAKALVGDQPNFRLAQLVYADLLLTRSGQVDSFGAAAAVHADPQTAGELAQMRDEAVRRIAALRERPPIGKVPAQFVILPERIRHAIAVDISRSRLYLFENGPQGVRLLTDHYASIGKQGFDKLVEGDQKTPLGVYFISESIDPKLLEDRFGSGALALNYPNAYDRVAGRTGSGILLHGVPSSTYARPPRATDGCVALSNDDLQRLARTIVARDTPVVIAKSIDWVDPTGARGQHADFLEALQQWQTARLKQDGAALARMQTETAAVVEIEPVLEAIRAADAADRGRPRAKPTVTPPSALAGFDDLTVLSFQERQPMMVVSFRERRTDGTQTRRMTRQYWAYDGERWKLLSQGQNG